MVQFHLSVGFFYKNLFNSFSFLHSIDTFVNFFFIKFFALSSNLLGQFNVYGISLYAQRFTITNVSIMLQVILFYLIIYVFGFNLTRINFINYKKKILHNLISSKNKSFFYMQDRLLFILYFL